MYKTLANYVKCSSPEGSFRQLGSTHIFSNTRKNILARYKRAYSNILDSRLFVDKQIARAQAFIKYEKLGIDKMELGKPGRLIQHRSYEYLYLLKSFVLQFDLVLKQKELYGFFDQPLHHVFSKLHDNAGLASSIKQSWDHFKTPFAVCLDHSKFDGHYDVPLLKAEHGFWDTLFNSSLLRSLLKMQLRNSVITHGGVRYKVEGKRLSGEYTTSAGNTLTNYIMIVCWLYSVGIVNARIHVNGDDSIIIIEREDYDRLPDLKFFREFGMETELEIATSIFQQIKFCQASPVRIDNCWRMIKNPYRTISRFCYANSKFRRCASRFLAGSSLCELAVHAGVPILQSFFLATLSNNIHSSPLGSVDKVPARLNSMKEITIQPISETARSDFELAFDVPVAEQLVIERDLAGILVKNPIHKTLLQKYIEKYKNFHLN